ncbi:hypothetical protein ACFWJM_01440 [Streptomyces sp. NPDC127077]|uniref:hypothetical protein n=1 Tax=Streptomyces sp. NPDC127077 TaxID=3347131 RepID=UPI003655823C
MTPRTPTTTAGGAGTARGPVLRVRGVTKSFGGAAALTDVDLDLYPGEVHALMGMNGAPADGARGVFYPGERSASLAAARAGEGVPVAAKVWRELTESAAGFGVTVPEVEG